MNGTNKREMAKEADKQDTQQGQLVCCGIEVSLAPVAG